MFLLHNAGLYAAVPQATPVQRQAMRAGHACAASTVEVSTSPHRLKQLHAQKAYRNMCGRSAHLMGKRIFGTERGRSGQVKVHMLTQRGAAYGDSGVIWFVSSADLRAVQI
jgi:hypothetical protein